MTTSAQPELSVVICSHEGEQTLTSTLSHVQGQSLGRSRYEVIVVDDGSTDRTSEIAELHGAHVVRLEVNAGLAAARNAGVSAAQAPVVAFTDDDCEPTEGWLAALVSGFSDAEIDGVGGRVLPASTDRFALRYVAARTPLAPLPADLLVSTSVAYRLCLYLRSVLRSDAEPRTGVQLYSVVGANMAFRRALIIELGGFDESFTFGAEEEDLCRRAHRRPGGAELRYEPSAVVRHRFQPTLPDSLRRARTYGQGHARAALKHADLRLIVYPSPLAIAIGTVAMLATGRKRAAALWALAPIAAYARWPAHAWRTKSLEPLVYPYLQLLEEVWTMLGELEGRNAGYARTQSRWLGSNPPSSSKRSGVS
jgi:cellulose synthase/poly-beta-1,6-N-acetylglucosamine synthase-like glycosyltransferase